MAHPAPADENKGHEAMQTPEALNAAFVSGDPHGVLVESLRFAEIASVLDIGCGAGAFVSRLIGEGFAAAGVDPNPVAIDKAREKLAEAKFVIAAAEDLPFDDGSFDAAVFLNSLHHVPVEAMGAALEEARRIVGKGGTILIVEPLAEGSSFEVMRPVEDESAIRHLAGAAIADAVRDGQVVLRGNVVFNHATRPAGVDEFLARLVAVDPARAPAADSHREEVERLFHEKAVREEGGFRLDQPLRIYWLVNE